MFASGSCLRVIEGGAFTKCYSLECIEIPRTVEVIGAECLLGCCALSSIVFASGSCLKRIGADAFRNTKNLKEIVIPGTVTDIEGNIFPFCNLDRVSFHPETQLYSVVRNFVICVDSMTIISAFRDEPSVIVPANVEALGTSSFASCTEMHSITFETESRLKLIGSEVFRFCHRSHWCGPFVPFLRGLCLVSNSLVDHASRSLNQEHSWSVETSRISYCQTQSS